MNSEAARIALRHRTGSLGRLPGSGRAASARGRGGQAAGRDHKRENVRALRQLQRNLQQQRAEKENTAPRNTFKLRCFENVPSRLHRTPTQTGPVSGSFSPLAREAPAPPPRCPSFSPLAWATPPPRPRSARAASFSPPPRTARPARAPRPGSAGAARIKIAFGTRVPAGSSSHAGGSPATADAPPQAAAALQVPGRRQSDETSKLPEGTFERNAEDSRRRGLQRLQGSLVRGLEAAAPRRKPQSAARQAEVQSPWWPETAGSAWQQEDAPDLGAAPEAPVVPQGYRLVPEEEKRETLVALQQKLSELDARYSRLPLKIETEGMRQQQQALRNKIRDMEECVQLFSRPGGVLMEI